MKTASKKGSKSPRDRIVATAADLIYQQGYRATGINEIIAKSGVAKATFYAHFRSKDELCAAYLKEMIDRDLEMVRQAVEREKDPFKRFMTPILGMEPWMKDNHFKGCPTLNMVPEIVDASHPVRKQGVKHYEEFRKLLLQITRELIKSNPRKYSGLDADRISRQYLILLGGAIAVSEIYSDAWPLRRAAEAVRRLVE